MPAPPELARRARQIRIPEVLAVGEPEHAPESDRHIGIGGKVKVQLKGKEQSRDPRAGKRVRLRADGAFLERLAADVRDQDLLRESDEKPLHARAEVHGRRFALRKRLFHVGILHDRTRDQLREAAHVQKQAEEPLLRFHAAAVHVDRVGQNLERIERDADRKPRGAERNAQHRAEHEARVLEPEQRKKRREYRERKPQFSFRGSLRRRDFPRAEIMQQRRSGEQQHHDGFAPRVKDQRKGDENAVAPAHAAAHEVQKQQQRQKNQ